LNSQILGLLFGFVIIFVSIGSSNQTGVMYFNYLSIVIVLGGTISASILTFGLKELKIVFSTLTKIFFRPVQEFKQVILEFIEISKKKNQGRTYTEILQGSYHPFTTDGLRLLENDLSLEQISSIMEISLVERKNYFLHQIEIVRTLAKYPPAFGMIGTVIGLVAVLEGLGTSTEITSIGPNMAIALITTLYGLFLSNVFFIPLSDNLLHRLNHSNRMRKMIIRGILLIKDDQDSVYIQEVLNAHQLPGSRENYILSKEGLD